jgi:hypothetical protein
MQTDRLMYLSLRAMTDVCRSIINPNTIAQKVYDAAEYAMTQFELEMGPLPEWASAHNISGEPVLYAQLYTLNGRQRGNGMIYHVGHSGKTFGVISDMGNTSTLNREELLSIYEIGDFILNEEGYLKRKRQNPDLVFEDEPE